MRRPGAFAPAGSSLGIRNIGIGRPPAISCAAAPGVGLFSFATIVGLNGTPILAPGLAALALIACGLTMLMFKISRPLRFIYVLRQPQRSWMSREAWIAGLLFPFTLFALWSYHPPFLVPAAMLGLLFLFCQGMILEQSKGIPAWRTPRVIAFIMATGLAEGCGLFLLLAAFLPNLGYAAKPFAIALVALAATRAWTWRRYFNALESEGAPSRTLEIFMACRGWFMAAGLVFPVVLVALGLVLTSADSALFALAGLVVFATGWAIKFILITRAAYNQGFALPHTPIRGSGRPGPAVKPGWTLP
jgi:phenylacetyl-CoA:acceptor oxidoreductase subunit 2